MLIKHTYHPYELGMSLQFKSVGGKFVSVVIKILSTAERHI